MSDRGMKKWAPYRSLIEQMPKLNKTIEQNNIIEKPIQSDDEIEQINEVLTNYHGEVLNITYYRNSKVIKEEIIIKKINVYDKKLILDNRKIIKFEEIMTLNIK